MSGSASSIKLRKFSPFLFVPLWFAIGASCQAVVTYSSKSSEELLCPLTNQTFTAAWTDETAGDLLSTYQRGKPDIDVVAPGSKHINLMYNVSASSFSLFILDVEAEDGGKYDCNTVGGGGAKTEHTVVVEVLAKPTVMNGSQDVDALDVMAGTSYDLTCSATGARSESDLSLVWDPSLVVKTPLTISSNGEYKDYSITSTYTAVKGDSSITCQLTGYVMQDEINDQRMEHISHTVNLNVQYAPVCNMSILEGEDCREVTLTCECDAVPAGITQYSFFNGSKNLNGTSNTSTVLVACGTSTEFTCSATNDIGPGDQADAKDHDCCMPVESGGLTTGAIVGSIVVMIAVVFFVVIAVKMWKKKCKPENGPRIEEKHEMQDPTTDGAEHLEGTHIGTDEQGDEGALPTQPLNTRKSVDGGHLN